MGLFQQASMSFKGKLVASLAEFHCVGLPKLQQ